MLFLGMLSFPAGLYAGDEPAAVADPPAPETQSTGMTQETPDDWNRFAVNEDLTLAFNGYLYLYHIRNHNSYYTDSNAAFTEATMALGIDFAFREEFSGQFRLVGTGLFGRPENWLGVEPDDMKPVMDLANVTWHTKLCDREFDLTAGLQEIIYGDGFLIMDGYSEERAIWTTPLRSFPALKGRLHLDGEDWLDVFTAHVRDDFNSYEAYLGTGDVYGTRGSLTGSNLHLEETTAGTFDVGLFYKDSSNEEGEPEPGSDTLAISLRDEIELDGLKLSGELVRQYGQTQVVNGVLQAEDRDRRAWGGHLTARYDLDANKDPYVLARYAYFGGDDDSSRSVESFDAMFFGWADWGNWYLGDMTSFQVVHTNSRVVQLEFGFAPTDVSKLRVLYFNTVLNEEIPSSNTKAWSHEVNVVYDYYFSDYVFCGLMGGVALPREAAENFNGDDETNYQGIAWMGFLF